MSSCPTCDAPVTPEDRFCGNCGMAQPPAASVSPQAGAARAAAAGEGYSGGAGDVSSAPSEPLGDEDSKTLDAPPAEPPGDAGSGGINPQF
ncbi:MAG TPA: zinc ribbon domain-containing protein, partial [Pyrinomonadaceae bacterium]